MTIQSDYHQNNSSQVQDKKVKKKKKTKLDLSEDSIYHVTRDDELEVLREFNQFTYKPYDY